MYSRDIPAFWDGYTSCLVHIVVLTQCLSHKNINTHILYTYTDTDRKFWKSPRRKFPQPKSSNVRLLKIYDQFTKIRINPLAVLLSGIKKIVFLFLQKFSLWKDWIYP